jgi:hypothetical protein
MTVTLTATYRETLDPETVDLIDKFQEEMFDLGCMLEFIDEHSEEDFREYYEEYVELGEENGYEVVDAFLKDNSAEGLKHFRSAYIGEYSSPASMAEDYFDGEVSRLCYMIVVDWEATAEYLLDQEVDRYGDHYFRTCY